MGEKIDDPTEPGRWDFPDANEWNPKGFFQDAHFSNMEDAEFGDAPPPFNWRPSALFASRLVELVNLRSARGVDWGLKSNRVQFYLSEFRKACSDHIKIITTRRHIARCIASWKARKGGDIGEGLIRAAADKLPSDGLVIDYDALFDATAETIAQIARYIGREVTQEAMDVVAPELRRH
jgi:hypothetical protein